MDDEKVFQEEEDTQKDKYLTFSLGEEVYGIDIKVVIEIIGIQKITVVPEVPEYVRGIINLLLASTIWLKKCISLRHIYPNI